MAIVNGYCTLTDLKDFVEVPQADTAHNADLERAVETASRTIDHYCGRIFYDTGSATAKTFQAEHPYRLDVPDFSTVTGLVVKTDTNSDGIFDLTWDEADRQPEPPSSVHEGRPFNRLTAVGAKRFPTGGLRFRVEVTARWGWAAVPVDVVQTTLIVATELWKRKDAPFGVAGFGPGGDAIRLAATERPLLARLDHYRPVLVY